MCKRKILFVQPLNHGEDYRLPITEIVWKGAIDHCHTCDGGGEASFLYSMTNRAPVPPQ